MHFSFQLPFFIALVDSAQHTPDAAVLLHFQGEERPVFWFDVSHSQSPSDPLPTAVHDCTNCCWTWDRSIYLVIHVVSETSMHYHFDVRCGTTGSKREFVYQLEWQGLHDMKLADVKYVHFSDEFSVKELYA